MYLAWLEQQHKACEVNSFSSFGIIFLHPSPANIIDAWMSQNTWKLFYDLILNLEELKVSPYLNHIYSVELEMENIPVGNREYIGRGIHGGSILKRVLFLMDACVFLFILYFYNVFRNEQNFSVYHPSTVTF